MSRLNTSFLKSVLRAMHATRTDSLVAPLTQGEGAILMLHHVGPDRGLDFEPNRILRITSEFLEDLICDVRSEGFEFIALDDVPGRLANPGKHSPFVCVTFDDGYRDNRDVAFPILKRHGVPFTVYIASDFADGKGDLWWLALEDIVRHATSIEAPIVGRSVGFETATTSQKLEAFHAIYWWLRGLPEDDARDQVRKLARSVGFEVPNYCADLAMDWDELRDFASDPLVTLGAHTIGHYALAGLSLERARREIAGSIERLEAELGRPCRHFSFPYGSEDAAGEREFELAAELGVTTAVTTRKGLIHASNANALTALPRLSLNGDFQDVRFVRTLLTGAPFALLNAVNRLKSPRALLGT